MEGERKNMGNVIKIDITKRKTLFDSFAIAALEETINRNSEVTDMIYTFSYDYDSVMIALNKKLNDVEIIELKSVSLTVEEYEIAEKSDKDIIDSLFNTIQVKR